VWAWLLKCTKACVPIYPRKRRNKKLLDCCFVQKKPTVRSWFFLFNACSGELPELPVKWERTNFQQEVFFMRLLIAIFLPFLLFFTIGRPIAGVVCLVLQITLIGWLPAALWAVYALSQYKTDQRIQEALVNRR
jgi:uncharacterized membrane protein YqaE (UPF0057 family)